ncbi:MAG: 2-amino-4-hydroxy-6-hydroxymethyldihydropteridine diphosphokinase [Paludibacter sp.]|nr:2-amino-4-hydroxy-6-hydroxymethyldihydropteridine diphosphokinase [Paludibacter sp.]
MSLVFLGLGTNLGNKERNLYDAILKLSLEVGALIRQSSFYASKSWGYESSNEFLNAVVLVDTDLLPFELLAKTQQIELELGRTAKTGSGYSDRLIDIDILLYDNFTIDQPTLKIPHPLLVERDFVLIPLAEIAPDLIHPVTKVRIKDLIYK